ncbi:MAG TPA: LysR family transcriptional regulator [Methylomirabilota bacterium]|nr:LysR family transcriptional regulator [Methylomirabilota bacterium]
MNFAAVDLNLMRVFDAMMLELNTTRAGERVGLSQPAVSSSLGRLRHITGDQLFVREGNRMVPTARARQLTEPVRAALRQIEEALASAARFDPSTSSGAYRIIGSDYFSTLLMPRLAKAIREQAPGITVQMLDRPNRDIVALLSDGTADLAVDSGFETPDWICSKTLFSSVMVTLARRDEPVLASAGLQPGDRIPAEVFCNLPHVLMSMDGALTGTIDRVLSSKGLERRIAVTVPHFHAVALTIAESGLLGSMPVHFARRVAPLLELDEYRLPFDPPPVDVMLYWHRRHDNDGAQAWLRASIAEAMNSASRT